MELEPDPESGRGDLDWKAKRGEIGGSEARESQRLRVETTALRKLVAALSLDRESR